MYPNKISLNWLNYKKIHVWENSKIFNRLWSVHLKNKFVQKTLRVKPIASYSSFHSCWERLKVPNWVSGFRKSFSGLQVPRESATKILRQDVVLVTREHEPFSSSPNTITPFPFHVPPYESHTLSLLPSLLFILV